MRDRRMHRYRRGAAIAHRVRSYKGWAGKIEETSKRKRALHDAAPFLVADVQTSAAKDYQIFTCFSPERTIVSPGLHW